jgi:hypothetical protein
MIIFVIVGVMKKSRSLSIAICVNRFGEILAIDRKFQKYLIKAFTGLHLRINGTPLLASPVAACFLLSARSVEKLFFKQKGFYFCLT